MRDKEHNFQQIVAENKDRIYRICYGYLYDQHAVDDLYQEILINVWNNLHKFRQEAAMSTWIYRIAVNTALMFNRKNRRYQEMHTHKFPEISLPDSETTVGEKKEKEKALELLTESIRALDENDRLIISMVLESMSYKEIADVMGLTVSHTGVKIKRIKEKLNKLMKKESYGI